MAGKEILIGDIKPPTLELGQFWRSDNKTYCFRPTCEGCKYDPTCVREEVEAKVGPGLNIRRGFRSRPGYKIVSIDYKGIELRVAAQLSKEPVFLKAFLEDKDLHMEMAKLAFKTDTPTKSQRDQAKCANFGNLFLGNPHTLARQSDLSLPEAIFIHREWWRNLPQYKSWTDRQLIIAKTQHKVTTFFGRVRGLSDLIRQAEAEEAGAKRGKGKGGWGFVHRTSVNSPVQGTAADLMKLAMVLVHDWIVKNQLEDRVRLLLTVHDELVFEVADDCYLLQTCEDIAKEMCPDLTKWGWTVPILTDIEIGDNWAELEHIKVLKKKAGIVEPEVQGVIAEVQRPRQVDGVLLVVNTKLSQTNLISLQNAILQASLPNGEAVKVPVKIQIMGKQYRSGTQAKVYEPLLRKYLKNIPGVEIQEMVA
jgi:hypothetical protein